MSIFDARRESLPGTDGAELYLIAPNAVAGRAPIWHPAGAMGPIVVVLLLLAMPAYAQVVAPADPAPLQFGPLSLYPAVQLVDAGIDDNVLSDSVNPERDTTFTALSQALGVLQLGPNDLVFLMGSNYLWFKDHPSQRSSNATYAARFNLSASHFRPYVGAARVWTRARPTPEIDARARQVERMATVGAAFDLTPRTAITASGEWSDHSFEDGERFRGVDLGEQLNSTGRSYAGGVRYAITPMTTVLVDGHYREERFLRSRLRDGKSYAVTPAVEFSPEAIITGSFSAGYELFVPESHELPKNRGFVFEGLLNWSIGSMTAFNLVAGRKVGYSYLEGLPYYLQTGGRLTITQRLFGPIGLRGSAEQQRLAYRRRQSLSPMPRLDDRLDTATLLRTGVTVDLARGVWAEIGAERTSRHSAEDASHNFKRVRLMSTISIGRPQ